MTPRPLDRRTVVGPNLLIAAGAAVAFLALTVAVLAHLRPLQSFDVAVSDAALRTALAHPRWRSAMGAVTMTGSTVILGPVAAVGCLVLLWRRRLRAAAFVALALPVTLAIRLLLVNAIHRPRPAHRLAPSAGWSFPSGHTAAATFALIVVLVCWSLVRRRAIRVVIACMAVGWALAVGISRVALVVHWPSDVVGGWLLVLAVVPPAALLLRASVPTVTAQ